MNKIKMTRQEWETILNEIQEMITSHVDYLVNGEGLNANGIVRELQNSRMYHEPDSVEIVEERSNKEIPVKPNYIYSDKFCSRCDCKVTIMGAWNMNYCSNCGQRQDWGDQYE